MEREKPSLLVFVNPDIRSIQKSSVIEIQSVMTRMEFGHNGDWVGQSSF